MQFIKILKFVFLFPFSLMYGAITWGRNKFFDLHIFSSVGFAVPVVSVGNITVGGTGKTPHVEYLADFLRKKYSLAVLSRGYKRKTHGFILANENSTPEELGDEPLQIKMKFPEVNVAVHKKRVEGVEKLMSMINPLEVILLDDAYQHRYVTPGMNILLVDYNRPVFSDFLLPLGRLREYGAGKKRADIIIVSKCPGELNILQQKKLIDEIKPLPRQKIFFSTFRYGNLQQVFECSKQLSTSHIRKANVLLVTGIANTESLKIFISGFTTNISVISFPDHHTFSPGDIQKIENHFRQMDGENKVIITTEKDAVKLRYCHTINNTIKNVWYYIPVSVIFLNNKEGAFKREINEYVERSKRGNCISAGKN